MAINFGKKWDRLGIYFIFKLKMDIMGHKKMYFGSKQRLKNQFIMSK